MDRRTVQKTFLHFVVVLLAFSGTLGVLVTLPDMIVHVPQRLLLIAASVSGGCLFALIASSQLEHERRLGFLLTGAGFALPALIAFGIEFWYPLSEATFRAITLSAWAISLATAHQFLLSFAELAFRFRWARLGSFLCAYSIASFVIAACWWPLESALFFQVLAVDAVLLLILGLLIPVFHRLSQLDVEIMLEHQPREARHIKVICPDCVCLQPSLPGRVQCKRCGCKFSVCYEDGKQDNRLHKQIDAVVQSMGRS